MRPFEYVVAADTAEASALSAEAGSVPKAGGVDLLDRMKEGLDQPQRLVALERAVGALVEQLPDGGMRLGASLTLALLSRTPVLRERYPSLVRAAESAATPQIREQATLGGNLLQRPRCWYFRSRHYICLKKGGTICWAQEGRHEEHALFDNQPCAVVHPSNLAPALVSLRARVVVRGTNPRELPLQDLYTRASSDPKVENVLRPGDILSHVVLPAESAGRRAAHYEVRARQSFDWPLAMAAVNLNGAEPLLVLGAVASTPLARPELSAAIHEWLARPTRARLDAVADGALQGAAPLPGNAWRLALARAAARRALLLAAGIPEEEW